MSSLFSSRTIYTATAETTRESRAGAPTTKQGRSRILTLTTAASDSVTRTHWDIQNFQI